MDSAKSPPAISMTDPLPPSLLFFVSHFHHLIPIKLNEHNYSIWKLQWEGALKASALFDYVQESQFPSPTIAGPTGNPIANLAYFTWFVVESHLHSCLISTLSPSILAQVTRTSTALELWEFLKYKFTESNSAEKNPGGELPSRHSPAVCQICAKNGHRAFRCCHRLVESFRPDKALHDATMASDSNANEVFDVSPEREMLAIADGSTVSADNTSRDTGTSMLFEPEMMGYQTLQGSGNPEKLPFQQNSVPKISEAKNKVISMQAKPENSLSGSKRKTPLPLCADDLSSNPLKKNTMDCFLSTCQVSRLGALEQSTDKNNDIGGSPKEIGNAIEHTRTTDDQKIQNLQDANPKGKSLPVFEKFDGGDTLVLTETIDDPKIRNSQEIAVEGNRLQVNERLNGGNSRNTVVLVGTTDDQKIQDSHETEAEGNPLQVNKEVNGGNTVVLMGTTDDQKIQNLHETEMEGNPLQVNKKLNGGNTVVLVGTTDDPKIQDSHETEVERNVLQVNKNLNGGKAIESGGPTDDQKIRDSHETEVDGNLLQVNKNLNGGKAIESSRTTDDQKILDSHETEVQGKVNKNLNGDKAIKSSGTTDDQKIQKSSKRRLEGESLHANKKLNGGNTTEVTGIDKSQELESLKRKLFRKLKKVKKQLNGSNTTEVTEIAKSQEKQMSLKRQLEVELRGAGEQLRLLRNSLHVKGILNGGKATELTEIAADQKIQTRQERELEENSLQVNKRLNGGNAIELMETNDFQKIQNLQERDLEEVSSLVKKKLNCGDAIELTGTVGHQKNQNSEERKLEGDTMQTNKILEGGNVTKLAGTSGDQKIQNSQESKLEGNSLHANERLNSGKAKELIGTVDDEKIRNPDGQKLEENPLQIYKMLNGGKATELMGSAADQKIQNPQMTKPEEKSLQVNKKLSGGDVKQSDNLPLVKGVNGVPVKKMQRPKKPMFCCELCGLGDVDERTMIAHLNGKRHRKQQNKFQQHAVFSATAELKEGPKKEKDPEVVAVLGTQEAEVNNNAPSADGDAVGNYPVNNEKLMDGEINESDENAQCVTTNEIKGQKKENETEVFTIEHTQETQSNYNLHHARDGDTAENPLVIQ